MGGKGAVMVVLSTALGAGCATQGRWTLGGHVETPAYAVLATAADVEIRRYEPMVVAETETDGGMDGRGGFKKLAGYIFGGNAREESISMTAPVAQQKVSTENGERWVMTFSMPSKHRMDTLPPPRDPRVKLKEVPATTMATVMFRGRWDNEDVMKRAAALEQAAIRQGWRVVGPPVFARYDPPWTPPFMRRNEVMLPVVKAEPGTQGG